MTPIGAWARRLVLGSATLLAAGCGGGSSDATASTAPADDQLTQGKRSLWLASSTIATRPPSAGAPSAR